MFLFILSALAGVAALIAVFHDYAEQIQLLFSGATKMLSDPYMQLVLAVIIWAIILSIVFAYLIDLVIEERIKSKRYHKEVLTQFEGLLEFMSGKRHYVEGETAVRWDNESLGNLIKKVTYEREPNEEVQTKLTEICRILREG